MVFFRFKKKYEIFSLFMKILTSKLIMFFKNTVRPPQVISIMCGHYLGMKIETNIRERNFNEIYHGVLYMTVVFKDLVIL